MLFRSGQIEVSKDLVAYTLGIVDDFYKNSANQSPFASDKQVSGAKINVSGNVMVDNDVMIDRWVNGGKINVEQSIFGVNGSATGTDPNESSGVFAQGPGSQVIAKRMFVAGQPYVTLAEGKKPLKLWESIGEPFDGVASFEGYATYDEQDSNKNYLSTDSPFYSLKIGRAHV